ncbi:MAG: hypothetical protein AAB372_00320 [Patescibacteria group bacterium]
MSAKSKYVLAEGIVVYNDPVMQSNLHLDFPRGFYANVWWSLGLNGTEPSLRHSRFALDYSIGWGKEWHEFRVNVGAGYLDLSDQDSFGGEDAARPYGEVKREFALTRTQRLVPFLNVEGHIPIEQGGEELNGVHALFGVEHQWEFFPACSLLNKFGWLYDSGTHRGLDSGFLGHYDFWLHWEIVPSVFIDLPTLQVIFPLTVHDERKTWYTFGGSLTYSF